MKESKKVMVYWEYLHLPITDAKEMYIYAGLVNYFKYAVEKGWKINYLPEEYLAKYYGFTKKAFRYYVNDLISKNLIYPYTNGQGYILAPHKVNISKIAAKKEEPKQQQQLIEVNDAYDLIERECMRDDYPETEDDDLKR